MSIEHPGCFGLPTALSANSPSCRSCPFQGSCGHAASSLLETLPCNPLTQRERLSLSLTRRALAGLPAQGSCPMPQRVVATTSRGGIKRCTLSAAQLSQFDSLPARVCAPARQLAERGWFDFARAEFRAGRNPASKGWRHVFCDLLLAGGTTRAELTLALVERLDLTPQSAKVQASVGMSIFAAGRIATEQGGHFALLPN